MSQHDTLTWPQAVDISNLPEVHEAIQAFTDDATEDNAVAIILAVSTALSATQPAQAAQSEPMSADQALDLITKATGWQSPPPSFFHVVRATEAHHGIGLKPAARFGNVHCSQCGGSFGPGNAGFSHCDDHGITQPAAVAQGAGEVVADLKRLSSVCPELNLNNYGPDDVDELNAWAIEVAQAIDQLADTAQPAPVVPDVQREIAAALALFPADLPGQTFRVGGYNNGQALEADNDTQFFSKKRVIALLEKLRGHLTAATTPTPPAQAAQQGEES